MSEAVRPYPWQLPVWRNVQSAQRAGRLGHALLFSGVAGTGKRRLVMAVAQSLLCKQPDEEGFACGRCRSCQLFQAGNHPDLLLVEPPEEGKGIGVDAVRELSRFQSLSPQYGRSQVVALLPAERMNANASNALLKTLEEPSGDTVLLLASDRPAALLPTIRSRCQQWTVAADSEAAGQWLTERLAQHSDNLPSADSLLALAGGAPLAALSLVKEGLLEQRQAFFSSWEELRQGEVDPVEVAAQWHKGPLDKLFSWLYGWLADLVRIKNAATCDSLHNPDLADRLQRLAEPLDLVSIYRLLDRVQEAMRLVNGQVNKQLLLEEFLLAWVLERSGKPN